MKLKCLLLALILTCTVFTPSVYATNDATVNDSPFIDSSEISEWAKEGVQKAYERELMKGQYNLSEELYFNPKGNVTFAEAFALVLNLIDNKNLDIKECMEKLEYPSVNLWSCITDWENYGQGSYYRTYLSKKYNNKTRIEMSYFATPIQEIIPYYYQAISYTDDIATPDDYIKEWGATSRELTNNYADKSAEEQLKYCFDKDFERINKETNIEFKTLLKKEALFKNYRYRLKVTKTEFPLDGVKRFIPNSSEERHRIQIEYINSKLYPNLQNKNHWGYQTYEELMKYMYLNGIINEEYISLDTPIKKDQFASLMYWVLAVSGQTFDWSSAPQFAVGKVLERLRHNKFNEFVNLPKDVEYVYAGPLNQLKELEIMVGEGGNTILYNSNITREQVALIINKIYEYSSDHSKMRRYNDINFNYENIPWYRTSVGFNQLDKNIFPYHCFLNPNNMISEIIYCKYRNNWIGE